MKKNLTVGMPLAVPTQKRPPDKYASHPYPFLIDEVMSVSSYCAGAGGLLPVNKDDMNIMSAILGMGVLKSVLINHELPTDIMSVISSCVGVGELVRLENGKYRIGLESLIINTRITGSGTLKKVLIRHDAGTDVMAVKSKIIGTGTMV